MNAPQAVFVLVFRGTRGFLLSHAGAERLLASVDGLEAVAFRGPVVIRDGQRHGNTVDFTYDGIAVTTTLSLFEALPYSKSCTADLDAPSPWAGIAAF